MTKSWRIDDFASDARRFYRELEVQFGVSAYHPIEATRFCLNNEDAKRCKRRLQNPRYRDVLEAFQEAGAEGDEFTDDYGSVRIKGVAWVDLPVVLRALRGHYAQTGHLVQSDFKHNELTRSRGAWSHRGEPCSGVVFCEGCELGANPWFGHLPLTPAKGETLLCQSKHPPSAEKLIHHEKWFLPYEDGNFRIGATYDESNLSTKPTDQGRAALADAFENLKRSQSELKVLKQIAGLRPSTQDARPFLGEHTKEAGLYIFNGLGSKGASLAPSLGKELLEFLLKGTPLDHETDIARFDTKSGPGSIHT